MKQTPSNLSRGIRPIRLIPVLLWMAVIFALSAQTGDEVGAFLPFFQKLFPGMESFDWGHFVSYFILALTADFAIGRVGDKWLVKLLIVVFCALYGITDEYHQLFVSGRTSDWMDVRNDAIGASLAVLALKIPTLRKIWRKAFG